MVGHHSFQPAAVYSQRKAFLTPRMVTPSSQDQRGVECVPSCVRNSPSYSTSPQGSPRAWFATLFSSYALLSATLSSTPFPVKAQWHEGLIAISTYGTSYAVLSAWVTPLIAFPLCPDKDEFCSHCFLDASMPEAGWLPPWSAVISLRWPFRDCFPLVIGSWKGETVDRLYIACPLAQGLEPIRNSYT